MNTLPFFTALLSVYRNETPLALSSSIESVWGNQSTKPNQIVLVQDGPLTPELYATIAYWQRQLGDVLEIVPLKENVGLAAALNEGLKHCKYELVARMDTDDIALPNRFELQLKFMQSHPDIAVCSGQVDEYSQDLTEHLSTRTLPLRHEQILEFAKKRNPISHPCVMFKTSAVLEVGGYPNIYPEDYPLWVLMLAKGYKFANLPETLVKMRVGDALTARRGAKFLRGELEIFKLMRDIGFINKFEYWVNVVQRAFVRLGPAWFKKLLYKFMR